MGSPTHRTIDPRDPLAYAPKWARNPVERQNTAEERSVCELADESITADDIAVTEWRPAPPSFDPLPAPPRRSSSQFPMGIAGATIAVAAIAVLLMLGKLPPWPVVAKDDGPEMGWFDSRFVGQRDRENFPSAAQFPGVKIAARPVNEEEALLGEGLRRHQVASIVTKPAPRTLDSEEIAVLVKRGQDLLSTGDIAAARAVLLRAAEARDPKAALALAATFDPVVLQKIGVYGIVVADILSARSWYEKAKEFGSEEAPRRLEMLMGREQ
jgi:hypothetical protein